MKIFFQSFLQIGLVAVNTLLISKQLFLGVFICSSAISLLWAFNVSKIALSDLKQKLIYALGAGTGAITGLFLVKCFLWKGLEQLSLTKKLVAVCQYRTLIKRKKAVAYSYKRLLYSRLFYTNKLKIKLWTH